MYQDYRRTFNLKSVDVTSLPDVDIKLLEGCLMVDALFIKIIWHKLKVQR